MEMAFDPISAGIGLVSSALSFGSARKARKKQERFMKKMMADRAKRIAEAKGEFQKSRRGLLTENRAAMNAAIAGAPVSLGASLMRGSTAANYMRSIYADAQRRAAEIGRQTAAGMSQLALMSPYHFVRIPRAALDAGLELRTQIVTGR